MNQVSAPSKRKVCVSIGNPRIALSVIWGHSDCRTIILIWKNFCLSSDCCGVILRNKCLAQTFCLWCYTRGYVYKWFLRLSLLLGSWLAILTISWYDTSFFPLRFYSKDNFPSGLHSKIVLLLLTLLKKKKKKRLLRCAKVFSRAITAVFCWEIIIHESVAFLHLSWAKALTSILFQAACPWMFVSALEDWDLSL